MMMSTAENLDNDEPITLAEACQLFPRAKLTISTLRAEAGRGRLRIFRLGKRDYTTVGSMREMIRLCPDVNRHRGFTSTAANGESETAKIESTQVALNQTVAVLKGSLPNSSAPSTRRRRAMTH
jgi:hypothetical protein